MTPQKLQTALDFLYSFIDYGVKRSYRYSPEVFDLGRVKSLLASLGDPQRMFRSIHIAGTKGKGSVAAMIESSLRAAGYRTGLYTSPHLIRFTERIQVDGQPIPDAKLVQLVDNLKPHVDDLPEISTYELTTALGFMYFAEQQVDISVVEVGLGGRLDATNVLEPLVSVISSLSYDHMHLLGKSLSDIAREKAGIIKPGVPLVLAPQQIEAEAVVRSVAHERNAPVLQVNRDWHYSAISRDLSGQNFKVWEAGKLEEAAELRLPLLGYHQVQNGALAYVGLNQLGERGLTIDLDVVREGFEGVVWPGRFQLLAENPAIVLDCAHNRDSALKLRIALEDYFPGRKVTMVFGASSDKDLRGMFLELSPRISRLILTQSDHPRSEDPDALAEIARTFGMEPEVIVPVAAAMQSAVEQAGPDEVVLGTGSLFVVGSALAAWHPEHTEFVASQREPA